MLLLTVRFMQSQSLSPQVGGEFAISTAEQRRQIDALKALEGCLAGMDPKATANFEGLNIRWGGPPWWHWFCVIGHGCK